MSGEGGAVRGAAGWFPDPSGQFELRYYDGSSWTRHVSTAGVTSTDEPPTLPQAAATATPILPTGVAITATKAKRPWWRRKRVLIPGVAVVGLIALSAAAGGGDDDGADVATEPQETVSDEASEEATTTVAVADDAPSSTVAAPDTTVASAPDTTVASAVPSIVGDQDEVDDVGPCAWVGPATIGSEYQLRVVNDSSEMSNYLITVAFLDAAGARLGDEPVFINNVRSGETADNLQLSFFDGAATGCQVIEVDRFASHSGEPEHLDEVACAINGLDALGFPNVEVLATNPSSEPSDYFIDVTIVRDGVRVGSGFATVTVVAPGQAAPASVLAPSIAGDSVDGATCEAVWVERSASE